MPIVFVCHARVGDTGGTELRVRRIANAGLHTAQEPVAMNLHVEHASAFDLKAPSSKKIALSRRRLQKFLSQNGDPRTSSAHPPVQNDPGRVRVRTHPTFTTRPGYFPPPYPRAEIEERGAKLLYPQLFVLICFLQQLLDAARTSKAKINSARKHATPFYQIRMVLAIR